MIPRQINEQNTSIFGHEGAFIRVRKAVNTMTVLLVLGTFLVFIVLDYALNRRKAIHTVPAEAHTAAADRLGSDYVDGFLVPANVSYHSGHSWLVRERQNVVRVGADEFAAALMGKIEKIELPKPGQWIRQGQKVMSFFRDGQKTEMVSPTEGEVMAINSDVLSCARIPTAKVGWSAFMFPTKKIPPGT
jgi:glycine cleavage system H lipoate-binding protein